MLSQFTIEFTGNIELGPFSMSINVGGAAQHFLARALSRAGSWFPIILQIVASRQKKISAHLSDLEFGVRQKTKENHGSKY